MTYDILLFSEDDADETHVCMSDDDLFELIYILLTDERNAEFSEYDHNSDSDCVTF